jgi:hypothetical protein
MTLKPKKLPSSRRVETTYGTAVALTGAEAIRTHGAKITPFNATADQARS